MWSSYAAIAWRQFAAHKLYAAINVVGLAVGLASFALIAVFVRYETSYDAFWPNADRIYRISRDYYAREGAPKRVPAQNNAPVAPALLADFPEIEQAARVFDDRALLTLGDKAFYEERIRWADPSFTAIFAFDWLAGDPKTALREPGSIVLGERLARKYFGADNPLGRTLTMDNRTPLRVTGVLRDLPGNTHLSFDALGSLATLVSLNGDVFVSRWDSSTDFHTYVLLREGARIAAVERGLPDFMNRHIRPEASSYSGMTVMNVRDIHTRSTRDEEWRPTRSAATLASFMGVAVLILLIACVNFMNLSTARAARRAREVGVRKSLGGTRSRLVAQFLGESIATTAVAMLLAAALIELALPAFGRFVDAPLVLRWFGAGGALGYAAALTVAVGVLAGSYPAFYLSAFSAANVLKGDVSRGAASLAFRNVLVAGQFAIAIALLIGTGVVYEQLRFARSLDLGFDKEQIVVLRAPDGGFGTGWFAFKNELERLPGVLNVTASHYTPFSFDDNRLPVRHPGETEFSRIQFMAVGYDFFATYRIGVLAGRTFGRDFATDPFVMPQPGGAAGRGTAVLNESAARLLGWSPGAAVGQDVALGFGEGNVVRTRVIGVVHDTYFESVAVRVRPMIYLFGMDPRSPFFAGFIRTASVRVTGGDLPRTLAGIDAAWHAYAPDRPIVRHFLDNDFEAQYLSEERQTQLLSTFALLAIFVACLGLLGLAWFSTERRTKEIGIRKAIGGSLLDIVRLFTGEFARLVLLANLVAWPIAYLAMHRWLATFAYRIDIGPLVFVGSALLALAVALLTVGAVATRAAVAKPIEALRYE